MWKWLLNLVCGKKTRRAETAHRDTDSFRLEDEPFLFGLALGLAIAMEDENYGN